MNKLNLNTLRDKAYKTAREHGFHENELSNEHLLCLVICELSEAVEADRKGKRADVGSYNILSKASIERTGNSKYFNEVAFRHKIKDTVEDELADAVIRLLDLAGLRNIDLELVEKDMSDNINDMAEACKDETFTETIYAISTLPVRYEGVFDFSTTINDMIYSIFGLAEHLNINLFWHIGQKMEYNQLRDKMHGKKY